MFWKKGKSHSQRSRVSTTNHWNNMIIILLHHTGTPRTQSDPTETRREVMGFPWRWEFALKTLHYVLQFLGQWDEDSVRGVVLTSSETNYHEWTQIAKTAAEQPHRHAAGNQLVSAVENSPYQLIPGRVWLPFTSQTSLFYCSQNCSKWQDLQI